MTQIGSYIDRDSLVHALHPFTKDLLFIAVFTLALLTNNPWFLAALFAAILGVGLAARLPIGQSLRTLKSVAALIVVFSILVWPFSLQEGQVLFRLGGLKAYSVGTIYSLSMSLRFCCIVLMSIYWMMFTSVSEITHGLTCFGVPYKIAFSFSMSLSFVPLILKDLSTIQDAQRSRALELDKGKLLEKIRKNVSILIPLSSRALGLINQISVSLEARGFETKRKRTSISASPLKAADYLAIGLCVCLIVALAVFRALGLYLITKSVL